jgi:O-antigen ligase
MRLHGRRLQTLIELPLAQAALAVAVSAVAAGAIAHGGGRTPVTIALLLAGAAAVWRWPALTLIGLLIVCQELDPAQGFGGPGASGLLFLGHQVFFDTVSRTSILTLILAATAAWTLIATKPVRPLPGALLIALVFGVYITVFMWVDGSALSSAINQNALFAVLFGLGFLVGCRATGNFGWRTYAAPALAAILSAMALVGLYLYASGQGQSGTGTSVIFYDSAMGAIAGAAALAGLTLERARRGRLAWVIVGAGLVIVVLAARRNVWAAIVVALAVALLVSPQRGRIVARLLGAAAVAVLAAVVLVPSLGSQIGDQLSAIWEATQGTAADASVHGHLSDISIGWHAVESSPLTGIGPHGQLLGLVNEGGGQLYVHNQILESWLRFGLIGAVLVVALQVVLVAQAVRVLRRTDTDLLDRWAAMLLLIAPVAMLTAPFLTQTERWPAILGVAAGLVGARLGRAGTSSASLHPVPAGGAQPPQPRA